MRFGHSGSLSLSLSLSLWSLFPNSTFFLSGKDKQHKYFISDSFFDRKICVCCLCLSISFSFSFSFFFFSIFWGANFHTIANSIFLAKKKKSSNLDLKRI
jgi:hypothetical protein